MLRKRTITVVGGPVSQKVDPVLNLTPTGNGRLADELASEFEKFFEHVDRLGNFPGGKNCDFKMLENEVRGLDTDVVVFLPHLPNILAEYSPAKIRLENDETGELKFRKAPKLVSLIKKTNPECLLIPFKLAEADLPLVAIVKWMLELHSALAVYSRIGEPGKYVIVDALANEKTVSREELPAALLESVKHFLYATRRRTVRIGTDVPEVQVLEDLTKFSHRMQPAFAQIMEKNVMSGRWPGNFSFRCTYGFLSARYGDGFVITKRNVCKTGMKPEDFVFVSNYLDKGHLVFSGNEYAKPSVDAPVHRVIYDQLPWVKAIVHGHMHAQGEPVHNEFLVRWPCGAENEAYDILTVAPQQDTDLWIANVDGHGFVALIGQGNLATNLEKLSSLRFTVSFSTT